MVYFARKKCKCYCFFCCTECMSPCGGFLCASRSTLPSPTHRHLFFLPLSAISRPACGARNVLPRTSFPARRTPTSRVERAGASDSVHPSPMRVHALLPRSLAPVGAPPSHRREERRGRAHRLSATCVQKCLHGAGERLSAGASMVAL